MGWRVKKPSVRNGKPTFHEVQEANSDMKEDWNNEELMDKLRKMKFQGKWKILEALNVTSLLESQDEMRSRSQFRNTLMTQRQPSMLVVVWRKVQ